MIYSLNNVRVMPLASIILSKASSIFSSRSRSASAKGKVLNRKCGGTSNADAICSTVFRFGDVSEFKSFETFPLVTPILFAKSVWDKLLISKRIRKLDLKTSCKGNIIIYFVYCLVYNA